MKKKKSTKIIKDKKTFIEILLIVVTFQLLLVGTLILFLK